MSATIILIIITCVVSFLAFQNQQLQSKLMLYPVVMRTPREAYRLISAGFVHMDTVHLAFNMISFFFFGRLLEEKIGSELFVMLYLSAILVANLPSYYKQMSNPNYAALGASGGVAAIIFAWIYLQPWKEIYLFMAIPMPALVFAVAYLIYSYVMSKKPEQHIGHDAHFWGSVYGFLFMIVIDQSHGASFLHQLMNPKLSWLN